MILNLYIQYNTWQPVGIEEIVDSSPEQTSVEYPMQMLLVFVDIFNEFYRNLSGLFNVGFAVRRNPNFHIRQNKKDCDRI